MLSDNHDISGFIEELRLVDHHVHSVLSTALSRHEFESHLTESSDPIPPWMTQFDSQVGLAVRRYCAEQLSLPRYASADTYWDARAAMTPDTLATALLTSSGISTSLIDTGVVQSVSGPAPLYGLADFAALSGQQVHEVVRLETVLENVAAKGVTASALEDAFDEALNAATIHAVGLKSIIAYRHGFHFDPTEPSSDEVRAAAGAWLAVSGAGPFRVSDPVLLRMLLWKGVKTGLPVQLHAGYGDSDLNLDQCNPLLLTPWLRVLPPDASDVVLLHCYPYHREAGYLAQVFPRVFFDVGLAINYSGAMSHRVVAESLELAPFAKLLFSTDAWGLPELHHIGAALWRRAMARILSSLVDAEDWSVDDAQRVAALIGRENAIRLYRLPTE
jgi:hypothetical protein